MGACGWPGGPGDRHIRRPFLCLVRRSPRAGMGARGIRKVPPSPTAAGCRSGRHRCPRSAGGWGIAFSHVAHRDVGWSTRLASTDSSITQQITADRRGDNHLWIYGSRSSAFTDYPVRVVVNGAAITDDLNSYLATGPPTWVNLPLQTTPNPGDQVRVQLIPTGKPNAIDRYIDIGGVYSHVAGMASAGTHAGTYLIVLGDDSLPLAPGGLPEPMVHGRCSCQ